MRYANIICDKNRNAAANLGDDLQILAIENLYREMGINYDEVVRIKLSEITTYDGEYVILPISFPLYLYHEKTFITMFSPKIIPVFLGVSIITEHLAQEDICYLRRYEPIGCRDYHTMELLRKNNIMCYLNGCMTGTFSRVDYNKNGKVYIVDIPKKYLCHIPEKLREGAVYKTQMIKEETDTEALMKDYLKEYGEEARLVITSRLHCAWPCVAMGIPVILMRETFSYRFTALSQCIHIYTESEFSDIDWNPSTVEYETEKKMIIENAINRVRETYGKYRTMYNISEFYEKDLKNKKVVLEGYDDTVEFIKNKFEKDEEFTYAIWGVTQTADMICSYVEENYPKAKLTTVYDRNKTADFHGVETTQDIGKLLVEDCFVFVTPVTAGKYAKEYFENNGKENYYNVNVWELEKSEY